MMHAHCEDGRWQGWICVRRPQDIGSHRDVSLDILHELGHLETGHGHDDVWRAWMRRQGLPVSRAFQKESRG